MAPSGGVDGLLIFSALSAVHNLHLRGAVVSMGRQAWRFEWTCCRWKIMETSRDGERRCSWDCAGNFEKVAMPPQHMF
jgi:hypothetical protein